MNRQRLSHMPLVGVYWKAATTRNFVSESLSLLLYVQTRCLGSFGCILNCWFALLKTTIDLDPLLDCFWSLLFVVDAFGQILGSNEDHDREGSSWMDWDFAVYQFDSRASVYFWLCGQGFINQHVFYHVFEVSVLLWFLARLHGNTNTVHINKYVRTNTNIHRDWESCT